MKKTTSQYTTAQEILYAVCAFAWNLCSQQLQSFAKLKALYTEAFIQQQLAAVQSARQLPQSRQTVVARKIARINLTNATRQALANWQVLKVYITAAFGKDMVKAKLEEAGASVYAKASVDNWSAVRNLIELANSFIDANIDELTSNENMPPAFQQTFLADGNNCLELSTLFAQADAEKEAATKAKVQANNSIYAALIDMLKDGQQIFRNEEAVKKQFTYSYLVSIFRGEGSASLKGIAVNSFGLPLQGATIVSASGKYIATTNAKGRYKISRIAAGTYTFTISCPGYITTDQSITFATGTASTVNVEMANQLKKVA